MTGQVPSYKERQTISEETVYFFYDFKTFLKLSVNPKYPGQVIRTKKYHSYCDDKTDQVLISKN